MSNTSGSTVLASINVSDAPVGRIFDFSDPDNSIEDTDFAGWELPLTPHRYWKRLSPFILDNEGGRTVLECELNVAAMMITGHEDWSDYTVQSRVRLECPELPNRGFYGVSDAIPYVIDIDDDGCDELVICYADQVLVYKADS